MQIRTTFVLAASLLAAAAIGVGAGPAGAATTTLFPVADTYAQADMPTSNFGAATSIKVDGSPVTVSYLKFNVPDLGGEPTKATLRVFKSLSTSTPINLRPVADNTWTETGLNYNNKPATGTPPIAPPPPWGQDVWLSYDVTSLVHNNATVSFALDTTSSTSKSLPSREATTNKPQLVLETGTATPPPSTDSTVIAVGGDVACGTTEANYNGGAGTDTACHMKQTSDLVLAMAPQQVFALGDLQYNSGKLSDFNVSYNNSWGRFKNKTNPVVGNHEYGTTNAGGYFTYFGNVAAPSNGYYSFNVTVGASKWHVAVINSECTRINGGVGCAEGTPQYTWLNTDLSNNGTQCTAVLTHRPRWSSNSFASPDIQPLVDIMDAHNGRPGDKVDLLLAGHAHSYERFAPQNYAGQADAAGIREIIVGTGGRDSQGFGTVVPNSLVRKNKIFGVMKLTLRPTGYDWAFVPDPATPFADSGTGTCN